mgnify:CR=1 FL=1
MLLSLLQFFATKFLVLALHLEAGSFPKPLTAREEIETFAALRAGDGSAREKLIRHNLRLVAHVAKKYYAQPGDQEDLISIGTIGLMKAVDTFDSTRKARFSTYASRCIENELRMYFRRERKNGGTVSLQETLEAGKDDTALTLSDVLQDGFCMEDRCEQQDEARRLRQLIELYVERVEILPDSVSVTLNILRGLQANESGAALDRLNRTYPEALKITRKADREEVVSASGE